MRHVPSEARRPGMQSHRRCCDCGAPLTTGDSLRCKACGPQLSDRARAAGEARRIARAEIEHIEREIEATDALLKRFMRRVYK
jgi:predicted amidophosphoribosyltransferase